jgi:cytochrome c5
MDKQGRICYDAGGLFIRTRKGEQMKAFYIGLLGVASLIAAGNAAAAQAKGDDIYKKSCGVCHDQGIAGAPKLGDKAAWAPHIKMGKEALYTIGIKGKPGTGMVAKGGNASLSDADVKAAVDFMVDKSK